MISVKRVNTVYRPAFAGSPSICLKPALTESAFSRLPTASAVPSFSSPSSKLAKVEKRKGDVISCASSSNRASFSPGCLWRGTLHVRRTLREEGKGKKRDEEGRKGECKEGIKTVRTKDGVERREMRCVAKKKSR